MNNQSVTDTLVQIEPVGAIFNIDSITIENFIEDYLANHDIAIEAARVSVKRDGRGERLRIFAFFKANSPDIMGKEALNIPVEFRSKLKAGKYSISYKLSKALQPLTDNYELLNFDSKGIVAIQLNEFLVSALMLSADLRTQQITIHEIQQLKHDRCVVSIIKQNKFENKNADIRGDLFSNIASRI